MGRHRSSYTHQRTLARPSKLLGQVLGGDLREELVLVRAPDDVDLVHGDLVQPDP
jgi:hypothetical protein